jgi:autotransporter adhesin
VIASLRDIAINPSGHSVEKIIMKNVMRLCALGAVAIAAALAAIPGAAYAQGPIEYVRVCDVYGAGFYYIPGTDRCYRSENGEIRWETIDGTQRNSTASNATMQGRNAFTSGSGTVAIGGDAWAGGDPTTDILPYDPLSGATLEQWQNQYRRSAFANDGTTAVGQNSRAGAGALGQVNATAMGQAAIANAANATAMGQAAIANAANATALGQGATANFAGSVAIGQGSETSAENTVSFGTAGSERRLTNISAGVMGTDAVNVAQLNAAIAGLTEGGTTSGSGSTAVGGGSQATYDGATAIGFGAIASADPTTAVGFGAQAIANNGSAFGGFAVASGENSTALGESAVASAMNATAVGRGAVATAANSVALGAGATATRGAQAGYAAFGLRDAQTSAGEVSVGSPGQARQITNVAAGSASTDAVNVAQLRGVAAEADAGTAAAMALAGLPAATSAGRSMVAGAVGVWDGKTAIAAGVSHRLDRNWSFRAGGTVTERGDAGFNTAVGFEF